MLQQSVRDLYEAVIEKTLDESRKEVERLHGVADPVADEDPTARQAANVQMAALEVLRLRWSTAMKNELARMDAIGGPPENAPPPMTAQAARRANGGATAAAAAQAAIAAAAAADASAPPHATEVAKDETAHGAAGAPQGDGVGDEERDVKRQKVDPPVNDLDDEDLGSGDDEDVSGLSDEEQECDNYILAQHEKVKRSARWKVTLKDGVVHINDKDLVFSKMTCEFTW